MYYSKNNSMLNNVKTKVSGKQNKSFINLHRFTIAHTHTHTHIYTCTYTHTNTHTHTQPPTLNISLCVQIAALKNSAFVSQTCLELLRSNL